MVEIDAVVILSILQDTAGAVVRLSCTLGLHPQASPADSPVGWPMTKAKRFSHTNRQSPVSVQAPVHAVFDWCSASTGSSRRMHYLL